tara:strand:+ start:163 stop:528 length:366 start_codon:yes stop_codon:yes gene_type:complete
MSKSIYKGGLRIKEQHLIILDIFRLQKRDELVAGSLAIYRTKIVAFLAMLIGLKFIFDIYLPSILEVLAIVVFTYLLATTLIGWADKLNKAVERNAFYSFIYAGVLLLCIFVLSLSFYVIG